MKTSDQPVVFVIDDDAAIRDSLALLMKSVQQPTQLYSSADEFLQGWNPDMTGCLVLDVRMPGMSGLELQKELIRRRISLPVIFITGHGDIQMAVEALKLGGFDFLEKPFRDEELLEKIKSALAQEKEDRELEHQKESIRKRVLSLTARELEIAQLLAQGNSNKTVAMDLGISQRTVELHRAHVMEKMQVRSLAQLVRQFVIIGQV